MARRLIGPALIGLTLIAVGATATTAAADGLPVLGVDAGPEGVEASAGDVRYVTLPAARGAVIARVQRDGGQVLRSSFLKGKFAVPVVAYDGSASGLSADGRTLVVVRPRASFPRATTVLAILDAERLRLRSVVTLPGDFSFDAISPNGAWLYLIEYVSSRDPTRYLVRAYDVRGERLISKPVVDPDEPGEDMRGSPITRATSSDGIWAYTLYDGAGGHPFIHALNTREHSAVCVDLHGLSDHPNLNGLRLAVNGRTLAVTDAGKPVAAVDTRTFRISQPAGQSAGETGWLPESWMLVVGAGIALLGIGMVQRASRRRRRLAPAHTQDASQSAG